MTELAPELGPHLTPGSTVCGKYRVESLLGHGGMSVVLAAIDLRLERRVALKALRSEMARRPEIQRRFAQEARAVARLQSEHVARLLDVDMLPDDTPFMVLEHLDGQNLRQRLEEGGLMPIPRAVDLVLQACEAIAEAHASGIVHRDLKPANLFLARRADGDEVVKVLDFGISKWLALGDVDAAVTDTADVFGSPKYMSPEQLRSSHHVTGRTDVWALSVILYELVGGRAPFAGESRAEVIGSVLHEKPLPLPKLRREVPAALWHAIRGALEKDAACRIPSVAAFARAIASFGSDDARRSLDRVARAAAADARIGSDTDAPQSLVGARSPDEREAATETQAEQSAPRSRGHARSIAAFAALAALLLGYAVLRSWRPAAAPAQTSGETRASSGESPATTAARAQATSQVLYERGDTALAPAAPTGSAMVPATQPVRRVARSAPGSSAAKPMATAPVDPACPDPRCSRK